MKQQSDPFGLRLPEALKQIVKEQAEQNGRSQHREIIYRLEQAYRAEAVAQNA